MKQVIRRGVFETNSSSTHSLVVVSAKEYEDFKKGKLVYDYYGEKLISKNIVATDFEEARKIAGDFGMIIPNGFQSRGNFFCAGLI